MVKLSRNAQNAFSELQDKSQFELCFVFPKGHGYQYHGLEWTVQQGIPGRV